MARIRSVHPGLWTDESFVSLTMPARLLAIGIWNECDDQGAFEWKPLTLKMRLLPADNLDVSALLAELEQADIVCSYQSGTKKYGAVRNFAKYQRPKKPNSIHPMTDELRTYAGHSAASSEPEADDDGPASPPVLHQFPTSGEKSPQMEDGGDKREEGKEGRAEAIASDAEASPAVPNARDTLWAEGLPILQRMTGKAPTQCRSVLGRLLRDVQDDCPRALTVLREAELLRPADPLAWITRAAAPQSGRSNRPATNGAIQLVRDAAARGEKLAEIPW